MLVDKAYNATPPKIMGSNERGFEEKPEGFKLPFVKFLKPFEFMTDCGLFVKMSKKSFDWFLCESYYKKLIMIKF